MPTVSTALLQSSKFRAKCVTLQQAPKTARNLSSSQQTALRSLKRKQDIVILKSDKGNATVVMDKEEYHQKCLALLQPPTYMCLKKDPTPKFERKVTEAFKDLKNKQLITKAHYEPSLSKAPRFYGLPKIHKPDTPLRPIVSAIGSLTYSLAKFVTSIISPLAGKTSSHVKNAKRFTEMTLEETVNKDEVMVSFDVQSLFTNVPVGQALDVIHDKLLTDETLEDGTPLTPQQIIYLLHICLRTTYFLYQGIYYEQTDETAMGSPVSPVVAMEHIEEQALTTSPGSGRGMWTTPSPLW